jgi:hypothetical protein
MLDEKIERDDDLKKGHPVPGQVRVRIRIMKLS